MVHDNIILDTSKLSRNMN